MRIPGSRAATLAIVAMMVLNGCGDDDQPLAPGDDTSDRTVLVQTQSAVAALAGVTEIDGPLRIIGVPGNDRIIDLSPLASLQRVQELEITETDLTSLHGLEGLTEIELQFTLQLNRRLESCAELANLRRVTAVEIFFNPLLDSLAPLGSIENLVDLTITYQDRLTTVDVFADLTHLELLDVDHCAVLTGLPLAQPLPALRELRLSLLPALAEVDLGARAMPDLEKIFLSVLPAAQIKGPLIEPSLTWLALSSLPMVHDFSWLGAAPQLEFLSCWHLNGLGSFAGATDLSSLTELRVMGDTPITDLASLPPLPSLTDLDLANFTETTLAGLPDLPQVERVWLTGFPQVTNLADLPAMPALSRLEVTCRGLVDLTGLTTPMNCVSLSVRHCRQLSSLDGLAYFPALRKLSVAYCPLLTTFGTTATLPDLVSLNLVACAGLGSLQNLPNAPALATIRLTECHGLVDLTGSTIPASIDTLEVRQNSQLTFLTGLESVQEIRRHLELDANESLVSLAGLSGLASVGDVTVTGNPNLSTPSIFAFLQDIEILGRVTVAGNGP